MYAQFEKISANNGDTYGIPYNYRSVMHYPKDAFAWKLGAVTMETLDPRFQNIIGKARDAAPSDYHKVCALYECSTCVRKPIQDEDSLKDPSNKITFAFDEDADGDGYFSDPASMFGNFTSVLGWVASFVMN